jgi:hypothetical protein
MEAREQSSDPKPKKKFKVGRPWKEERMLGAGGGEKGGGMKEAILHSLNG